MPQADGGTVGILHADAPDLHAQGLTGVGPEFGEETEQHEQQHCREQRVAIERACLSERAHFFFTDDPHLDHLVDTAGDDQQRGAQQEVVEHRCQATTQASGRKFALGVKQVFRHGWLSAEKESHFTDLRAQKSP
ncbi:hypothetical protein D3C86_1785150 [compost metagenome]